MACTSRAIEGRIPRSKVSKEIVAMAETVELCFFVDVLLESHTVLSSAHVRYRTLVSSPFRNLLSGAFKAGRRSADARKNDEKGRVTS